MCCLGGNTKGQIGWRRSAFSGGHCSCLSLWFVGPHHHWLSQLTSYFHIPLLRLAFLPTHFHISERHYMSIIQVFVLAWGLLCRKPRVLIEIVQLT